MDWKEVNWQQLRGEVADTGSEKPKNDFGLVFMGRLDKVSRKLRKLYGYRPYSINNEQGGIFRNDCDSRNY